MTNKTLNKILSDLGKTITYSTYMNIQNVMFIDTLALAYQSVDDSGNKILITNIEDFPKSCSAKLIKDCLDANEKDLGTIKRINWQHMQDKTFVIADIETTGYSPTAGGRIIEIGAIKIDEFGNKIDTFHEYINPLLKISTKITELTGITNDMVKDKETIGPVLRRFLKFFKGSTIVFHNANFDWNTYLIEDYKRIGIRIPESYPCIDTLLLSKEYFPNEKKHDLESICNRLNIDIEDHHQAFKDVEMTTKFFLFFKKEFKSRYEHLPYTNWIFAQSQNNIKVKSVGRFEKIKPKKQQYEILRAYVNFNCNGINGSGYYDFLINDWGMKNFEGSLDSAELEEPTLKFLNVSNVNEILDVVKKEK